MATQELGATAIDADTKEDTKKKPGPNNPEEASKFMEEVSKAVDHFMTTIHQYKPYSVQSAYKDFINTCYRLLCDIEDYFKDTSTKQVLEFINNTTCKMMHMQTERECEDQELRKDPRARTNNIMQSHHVMNHLEALPGFKKFEGSEQFAISELFHHLQRAYNTSSEAAGHLTFLARTLQPTQFEFILKHSVCPLVQFQIPARLCNPGELCFAKSELTSDELFEQKAVNTILPQPYHPKLECVENKHAIHCLAVAVYYQLHQKLCTTFRESQANTADMFGVKHKKFYTSVSGRMYDAGKKLTKAEKKECDAYELKKQKLVGQTPKVEKKDMTKEKETAAATTAEDEDMPMLISDSKEEQE